MVKQAKNSGSCRKKASKKRRMKGVHATVANNTYSGSLFLPLRSWTHALEVHRMRFIRPHGSLQPCVFYSTAMEHVGQF